MLEGHFIASYWDIVITSWPTDWLLRSADFNQHTFFEKTLFYFIAVPLY